MKPTNSFNTFAIVAVVAVLLTSCSHPGYRHSAQLPADNPEPLQQLYRVDIESFWQERYTGLLAITINKSGFDFALLDTLGVTLLETSVTLHGTLQKSNGVEQLKKMHLDKVLAGSLHHIFFVQPGKVNCSDEVWTILCEKVLDATTRIKYFRSGPIITWKSRYHNNHKIIRYTRPWVGFALTLRLL